jgi:hypothetical protein
MVPVSEWGQYFDTIVGVIDPVGGRVMMSQRFPGVLAGFTRVGSSVDLRRFSVDGAWSFYSVRSMSK